ncbi:MAG: PilN domain-containing protein [Gammaproteobacteria bacterium]|nr:PilN domain-containing protein [Gammaproteobacteria bacterium]
MKTALSFIPHPGRWVKVATVFLYGSAAGVIALGFWAVMSASTVRSELPDLRERLAKVVAETKTKSPAQKNAREAVLPSDDVLNALRQRVAGMNVLLGRSGTPLQDHLTLLEKLLPVNARLVSLHHLSETGTVSLLAESESHEALALFLQNLEASGQFAEVLLLRQSQSAGRAGSLRQFEIRLKERL